MKAAVLRRAHSTHRGLVLFGHWDQSADEDKSRSKLLTEPPSSVILAGEFFAGYERGQELSSSRPLPPGPDHQSGAAASPGRRTIAGLACSYIRILPLPRRKEIGREQASRGSARLISGLTVCTAGALGLGVSRAGRRYIRARPAPNVRRRL
jgi:hypothetical protein